MTSRTLEDTTLEPPVLEVGAVVGERYEVECLLGAGTFAQVYRARDLIVPDHTVSLKISRDPATDEQAVRAAMRELRLIASVFHPSIVQLKDHGWHQSRLWFVMPLYRGETLATCLSRAPLSRRAAREIFEPLAEALATLHRAGVRHQDIKPDNIFLAQLDPDAERRLPVLIDLGLAVKDVELVLAGTPTYLAPEVAARFAGLPDPAPVGPKADVFALALTLRQALDPSLPDEVLDEGVDAFVALRARVAPRPPTRRDLQDLRSHFDRWLNISPDVRPTAEEFRRELRVLTRADEERARRLKLARWLVPTTLAIIALFVATAMVLTREAELQRLQAHHERVRASQAQARALSMRSNLEEEKGRRRLVETEFRNTQLSYGELEQRLMRVEQELASQQRLAEESAAELCRLRKEPDCKPLQQPDSGPPSAGPIAAVGLPPQALAAPAVGPRPPDGPAPPPPPPPVAPEQAPPPLPGEPAPSPTPAHPADPPTEADPAP